MSCCVQLINILTLGSPQGVGVFFPSGFLGAINKPASYNESLPGLDSFPATNARVATQVLLHTAFALLLHLFCYTTSKCCNWP